MHIFPVLFISKSSEYKLDVRFDGYDIERCALSVNNFLPAVYHPPCRLFSKLKAFSKAPQEEKRLAYWSIVRVRKYGGIVEHPLGSSLPKEVGFPGYNKFDKHGGVWVVINQVDFGYLTKKPTILYIVGLKNLSQLPVYPLIFPKKLRKFSDLSPRQRSLTVIGLRDYFYEILLTILKNTQ